jgi:hypothetical protein
MKVTKIVRNKEYGCWSVQLHDEESGRYYWMDVSYDEKYHEIDVDWNQYIFYLTDEDDLERKAFQEDCDNFDEADSLVYSTLLSEGEIKETDIDRGGLEIAVEKWQEKILEIRQ